MPPVRTCWGEQARTGGLNLFGQAFVLQLHQGRTNMVDFIRHRHRQDERLAVSRELRLLRLATLNQEGAG